MISHFSEKQVHKREMLFKLCLLLKEQQTDITFTLEWSQELASQSQIRVNFQTTLPQWISTKVNILSIKLRMWTDFHFCYAAESLVYFYINNKNRKDCEFRDVAQMSKHFISVIKGSNLLCMFKTHSCTQSNYHLTDTQKPRIHFINVPL